MEKLKNLLNPGKDIDDEVMYGSGVSPDPVHSGNTGTLTGEGSHLAQARDTPLDSSKTTAGPHTSDLANKADPRVDSDLDGSRTVPGGATTAGTGSGTTSGGYPDASSSPYSNKELDPRLDGGNKLATGTSTTGSNLPSSAQDTTAVTGTTGTTGTTNTTGSTGSTLPASTDNTIGQDTAGRTHHHLGRDAAAVGTAGAVGEGIHHHRENETDNTNTSGYGTTATGSSITGPGPNTSANTTSGTTAPTTAGPHSSDLMNKADPRVDSDNSKAEHHYGRDAAAVGTAGAVAEGVHRHRERDNEPLGTTGGLSNTTGPGPNTTADTTTAGPHKSNVLNKLDPRVDSDQSKAVDNTRVDHHHGRDAAAVGGAAAVGEGIHHHREGEHGNVEPTSYSGTTPSGVGSSYYGGPSGTAVSDVSGPHSTSTANRLDPRINQNAQPIDNASEHDPLTGGGGASADAAHGRDQHHLGRDAAVGAGAAGLAEHEHRKHEHERATDVGPTAARTTGSSAVPEGTAGPHGSRLANVVDPRVDSDLDGSRHVGGTTTGPVAGTGTGDITAGTGSSTGPTSSTGPSSTTATGDSSHHYGRDAAIGAGGVGLAEHERKKHEQESDVGRDATVGTAGTIGTGPAPNTSGPHKKDWMNKLDPRVKSSPTAVPTGSTGSHNTTDTANETTGMRNRNAYADPGAHDTPGFVSSAATPGHPTHGERDAVAGAGLTGAAGYEAEKRHAEGSHHGVSEGYDEKNLSKDHHYGRDAAAVGAAGVGAHEISKHHKEHHRVNEPGDSSTTGTTASTTGTTTAEQRTATAGPSGTQAAGLGSATGLSEHERLKREAAADQPGNQYGQTVPAGDAPVREDHHLGRDATAAGVVGAGAYEAERHHKHDKDLTAAEKEEKRELKREQKEEKRELRREEKEAKLEQKEEKKETKVEQKEEKKHGGGLFGFLHRDKTKKYTKDEEDEFDRQEREYNEHPGRDAAVGGAAVGGAAYEAEKHHRHHGTSAAEAEPDTMKPLPIAPGNHGIGTGEGTQNALVMDRKRGEGYDTTTDPSHHYGRDATAVGGAAALAEHEHKKNESDPSGLTGTKGYGSPGTTIGDKLHGIERNRGAGATEAATGEVPTGEPGTTTAGTSHLGRDAAVGAGGVGLAEHEHRKHELEQGSGVGSTTAGTATTDSGIDNTATTGTGTTAGSSGIGYGANDPVTGLLGSNTQPERAAAYRDPVTKHNVLHKDPPPGHPASRVPVAGTAAETGYTEDPQRTTGGPGTVNPK